MENDRPINTIGATPQLDSNSEGADVQEDSMYPTMSEEEFGILVTNRTTRATAHWNKIKLSDRQDTNFKYWVGDQVNKSELRDDLEKGADNAIFRNIETLIPIATARRPELTVTPGVKNDQTRDFASGVKRIDETEWEVYQNIQPLIGRGIRNHQMNFIAVFQLGYDPLEDKFWTVEISAKDVVIDRFGHFIARTIRDETVGDLLKKFPEKKEKIVSELALPTTEDALKKVLDSSVVYTEAWTDEVVGWKLNNLVLGVKRNPHFDYKGVKYEMPGATPDPVTGATIPEQKTVQFNFFKTPRMPFLFLTYFNRGTQVIDDTSLIEQAIGPQDWINKRKRQIGANADSMNGHWVSSGDFISQEEFDKIQGGIDEKIWLQNGLPGNGIAHITGPELPQFVYNDLVDSRGVIDNLMGTHSTTRGAESTNKTATQDIMQKDQDYGRIDGYVRDGIELLAQKWYEYMFHLYLVYRVEETSIAIPEDDDFETDNVVFSRDTVPIMQKKNGDLVIVPLIFKVKQGSTLPKDEVSEAIKADKMKETLSPIDYFKKVGEANPRELAKNKLIWDQDPYSFFKDDKDIQEMLQRIAQANAAAAQTVSPGGPAGGPTPTEGAPANMGPEGGSTPEGTARAMKVAMDQNPDMANQVAQMMSTGQ